VALTRPAAARAHSQGQNAERFAEQMRLDLPQVRPRCRCIYKASLPADPAGLARRHNRQVLGLMRVVTLTAPHTATPLQVVVPRTYFEYTSRRVLTTEVRREECMCALALTRHWSPLHGPDDETIVLCTRRVSRGEAGVPGA
jgi:hypothetical protein